LVGSHAIFGPSVQPPELSWSESKTTLPGATVGKLFGAPVHIATSRWALPVPAHAGPGLVCSVTAAIATTGLPTDQDTSEDQVSHLHRTNAPELLLPLNPGRGLDLSSLDVNDVPPLVLQDHPQLPGPGHSC